MAGKIGSIKLNDLNDSNNVYLRNEINYNKPGNLKT